MANAESKPLAQLTDSDKAADVMAVGKPLKGREPKPSTAMVPALSDEDRRELRRLGAKVLTSAQIDGSVSISCLITKRSTSP
jgi:hypothetical protein